MAASVVGAIAPQLERAEIDRAQRKQTDSLDASDYYLRAVACFHKRTKEATAEARPLLCTSMALDTNHTAASGLAPRAYSGRPILGGMAERPQDGSEGPRLPRRAVKLRGED